MTTAVRSLYQRERSYLDLYTVYSAAIIEL